MDLCTAPADGVWQELAEEIGDQPVSLVRIEGHADTSVERSEKNDEYNLPLSQERAEAVKAELEAVFSSTGIEVAEWQTFGFGSSRLAVQTGPDVRERENRRAVITVFFKTDES
jgi:outer membrane protein OmpA-like peptidoglycan-associated protein